MQRKERRRNRVDRTYRRQDKKRKDFKPKYKDNFIICEIFLLKGKDFQTYFG